MRRIPVIAAVLCLACAPAFAQQWPQKPIRIIVGLGAGGPPDVGTRAVAPKIGETLGQPVIVENRPGAGGSLAMQMVARAAPDGYTLGLGTIATLLLAKALIPTVEYDPITSFMPLGFFAKTSFVMVVHPKVPAKTVQELIALAKAQPGKLNYGASTPGTPPHILAEMFKTQANVDLFGINYKTSPESVQALIAGDVQVLIDAPTPIIPLAAAGKVRPLMMLSRERSRRFPDVPSATEAGLPELAVDSWFSLVAPSGTPDPVVRRLNAAITQAAKSPEVIARLEKLGLDPMTGTVEEAQALIKSDWPKWAAAVKASGAKAN